MGKADSGVYGMPETVAVKDEVAYHFCGAVNKEDERTITLATGEKI